MKLNEVHRRMWKEIFLLVMSVPTKKTTIGTIKILTFFFSILDQNCNY